MLLFILALRKNLITAINARRRRRIRIAHPIQILYDDVPFIFLLADAQKLQSALAGEQRLLRDSKHGNHC